MKPAVQPLPLLFGGTGYDSANQDMPDSIPERYEIGTTNIVGIAGLNASLRWIEEQTIPYLFKCEKEQRMRLISLLNRFDYLSIIGNEEGCRYVGIVSCVMEGISSDSAGSIFSEYGIAVRTGLQCAPRAHRFLNTFPEGTIRFSVNSLTSDDDFHALEIALETIENQL